LDSNPKAPLRRRKVLILRLHKTHRPQEPLLSLRSYYDRPRSSDCHVTKRKVARPCASAC
jgi:hypothetical protein